eukprot:scaffold1973_cov399-Prasinococcus_capsulatus_cf.AAC.11
MLVGLMSVTRSRWKTFRFSYTDSQCVQVTCATEDDPRQLDVGDALYDEELEWKKNTGKELNRFHISTPFRRQLAEQFCKSGVTVALLLFSQELIGPGVKGADPYLCSKLFTASTATGGASNWDCMTGNAQRWECNDPTFVMTGAQGRVLWTPIP